MLREEHRLRVFENRVLRRMFGHKREEMSGNWRKMRNEEIHNLYSSPNIFFYLLQHPGTIWGPPTLPPDDYFHGYKVAGA
jgi:hypothetical protein